MAKKQRRNLDQKNSRILVASAAYGTLKYMVEYTKQARAVINLAWDDLDGWDPQKVRDERDELIPHFRGFFDLDEHSEEGTVEELDGLMTGVIRVCESFARDIEQQTLQIVPSGEGRVRVSHCSAK